MRYNVIENDKSKLTFDISSGLAISSLVSKNRSFDYISSPTAFFGFAIDSVEYKSDCGNPFSLPGVIIDEVGSARNALSIRCHANGIEDIVFVLELGAPDGQQAVRVKMRVINNGLSRREIKIMLPCLSGIVTPGANADQPLTLGMVPQEIGGVAELIPGRRLGSYLPDMTSGLPAGANLMEVAALFDKETGLGVFAANLEEKGSDGDYSQLTLSGGCITGVALIDLGPGQARTLPEIALGLLEGGGWQEAVDYCAHNRREALPAPETPDWFRESGALWTPHMSAFGGPFLDFGFRDLNKFVSSFEELPALFRQAQEHGSGVMLLNDYWKGDCEADGFPRIWGRGDYIPREDLGGGRALKKAVDDIHAMGGRVLFYVDPVFLYYNSILGHDKGEEWRARRPDSMLIMYFFLYHTMPLPFEPWQEHILRVVERLVGEYDADGIYLDSIGRKFNVRCVNRAENRLYPIPEWNQSLHSFIGRIRDAVTALKPDGVVMCNTVSDGVSRCADGGFSDFIKMSAQHGERLACSPARYALPHVKFFAKGSTANQMLQIYASGHSLIFDNDWLGQDDSGIFKKLLDIRLEYKEAFMSGKQANPSSGDQDVIAYLYTGTKSELFILLNTSASWKEVCVEAGGGEWKNLLTGGRTAAHGGRLSVSLGPADEPTYGICVLARSK